MNIAIIGCGKQAPKHISGLIDRDDVEGIIVADLVLAQADGLAAKYETKVKAGTIDGVFNDPSIDGVIISTPTPSHVELCQRAIHAGKPFLVEKPLASSLSEARALHALSKEKNVPGMVGFIYRFSPTYETFNDVLINNDAIGQATHAIFRIAGRGSHQEWKHKADKNGGAISEMMVHMIDLAVWYFGKAQEITLMDGDILRGERVINGETVGCDAEDWSVAQLKMESGARVLIQADMVSPVFKQYAEINGSNGILEGSIQPHYVDSLSLFEARGSYQKGYQTLESPRANNYVGQGKCFIDMVKSGNDPERCSLGDAVEVMRIQDELKSKMKLA